MNLAQTNGIKIFNDAIMVTLSHKSRKIHVHHEVPEHTEWCETMRIPTDSDFTDWNENLKAWQCQYCQRVYDTNTKQYITEEEHKELHKYD